MPLALYRLSYCTTTRKKLSKSMKIFSSSQEHLTSLNMDHFPVNDTIVHQAKASSHAAVVADQFAELKNKTNLVGGGF
ncbi:hypothetical protein TYRP_011706 [Tyrophagus putrescentiae]|nr:hypothetical protein TYRP_011706 [Tyrophagus putrescentiae]